VSTSEKLIEVANKLFSARRSLKSCYPDYETEIVIWRNVVKAAMEKHGCEPVNALLFLLKEPEFSGNAKLWLMAAAVDVSEGIL
jgi:hypothetical protein